MKPAPSTKHLLRHYTAFGALTACGITAGSYLASSYRVAFTYPMTKQTRLVTCRRCVATDQFVKANERSRKGKQR